MNRIILSAVIAIGFHIALMVLLPSIIKKDNDKLPPQIKSIMVKPVMVTLSCRQPAIKKAILPAKQIEKIKPVPRPRQEPEPKQTLAFTPKKKTTPVLKKKNRVNFPKKVTPNTPVIPKQKELIKSPLPPVKTAPVTAEAAQIIQMKPITKQTAKDHSIILKKTSPQKKENIKKTQIEFAKPLYKKNSLPAYPGIARKRGYQGIVELMVLVSEDGKISALKISLSSGYKSLDRQAVKTVKNWRFEPGKKNGIPLKMWVKIPVKFEIK